MWNFLHPPTGPATSLPPTTKTNHTAINRDTAVDTPGETTSQGDGIFTGYESDWSEDDLGDTDNEEEPESINKCEPQTKDPADSGIPHPGENPILIPPISVVGVAERKRRCITAETSVPPLKRQRQEIPVRIQRNGRKNELECIRRIAMAELEKWLNSSQSHFESGRNGLQARRARVICSYLHMIVQNGRKKIEASERAAEAQGFAARWGGRQVRSWAEMWITHRKLPESKRGKHVKLFSLLGDPDICAELRSYVRSNKWAMDPAKLADFSTKKMVPKVAEAYGTNAMNNEIPAGLKGYLELELFPRIHMKVTRGISLSTARRWLHCQGFRFTEHRKALYFDGHERPDVVEYRQNSFLPRLKEYRQRLVEFVVGEVEKEQEKPMKNYVERRLVLVSHDESTVQANDGKKMSWVHEKEHALKKKGAGRGIHQSDVICSTVGWLKSASQSLEYGKNYEGYWNGELFVKQVCHNYNA